MTWNFSGAGHLELLELGMYVSQVSLNQIYVMCYAVLCCAVAVG